MQNAEVRIQNPEQRNGASSPEFRIPNLELRTPSGEPANGKTANGELRLAPRRLLDGRLR
jgi:hypothetical protein